MPWLLPLLKNEFLKEAKTEKTGTKFIISDTAQQVGEHTEKQFVLDRSKADIDTLREGVWESSLMRRSAPER